VIIKNGELGNYQNIFLDFRSLPPNGVENYFTNDLVSTQPDNEGLQKFMEYLLKNYIHPDTNFPPKLWSAFKPRTIRIINAFSSIHSYFNSMFYSAHLNIVQFIHIYKNVRIDIYIKMRNPEVLPSE